MTRLPPLLWFLLIMILLLPSAAGRFLLDLAGGLMLALLAVPILLAGIGWIGWRILQSKLIQCKICGASIINESKICPVCGANLSTEINSIPASSATIDITAKDVDEQR